MSNVVVEMPATELGADVVSGSLRTTVPAPADVLAAPLSASASPSAVRLSAELVAVIALWMERPRWRHGISPATPEYRRILP